ncbi:MAG: hypothetical protein PVH25_12800 [Burkholderiales bacterium]|jgi:hypothetical protein
MKKSVAAASMMLACGLAFADDSNQALEQRIEELQKQIDALKQEVKNSSGSEQTGSEQTSAAASPQVETGTDTGSKSISAVDEANDMYLKFVSAAENPEEGRTSVGGYGEINYNNYKDSDKRDEFDLQRLILFVGHRFSERTRLYSEIEFEHAYVEGGEDSGEVALEQAYIEQRLTDTGSANLLAGLFLLPIGFMNEYHEPPVFYGVERNEVESRIIPTTWREIGFSLKGNVASGLEYNAGFSTTPDASLFNNASTGFRSMRTKGSQVTANEFGYFAALNYRGILGLQLGGSVWTGNTAQDGQGKGPDPTPLTGANANLTLWELHARYAVAGWDLRALYTQGYIDDTAAINAAAGIPLGSDNAAPESLYGWYVEAAYRFGLKNNKAVTPFVRFAKYDTQEEVAAGYAINPLNNEQVITAGLNFYVHPQVVFKIDVQDYDTDDSKDRFDIGIGWMF